MIIKNMEEFGKAVDAKKQLQCTSGSPDHWVDEDFLDNDLVDIEAFIHSGFIRTKPEFVYYRAWEDNTGILRIAKSPTPFEEFDQWCGPLSTMVSFKHEFDHKLESEK